MWQKIKKLFEKNGFNGAQRDVQINILTRTSGRPNGFHRCFESVQDQSYKHVKHIVSYDSPDDLQYLNDYNITKLVRVKQKNFTSPFSKKGKLEDFKPYNLYCNKLIRKVKSGWILFLDDDDMLLHDDVLHELAKIIKTVEKHTLIIWQTEYPDGTRIPRDNSFLNKEIKFMDIDTACFAVHSDYAMSVKWDAWRGADFRYIKKLSEKVKSSYWIKKPLTKKNNFGDHGQRNDIPLHS